MTREPQTLVLSDGTTYRVDGNGNVMHVAMDTAEDVVEDFSDYSTLTATTNTDERVADVTRETMARAYESLQDAMIQHQASNSSTIRFSGREQEGLSATGDWSYSTWLSSDFTSDPIENFSWILFRALWDTTDFSDGDSPSQNFHIVMRNYRRAIRLDPSLRDMGNTQRVSVDTNNRIGLVPNHGRRRREGLQASNRLYITDNVNIGLDYSDGAVLRAEPGSIRPMDYFAEYMGSTSDEISSSWPEHDQPLRGTGSSLTRQIRPKTCLHKTCIKCQGKGKDGRGNDCPHEFRCHCVECQP